MTESFNIGVIGGADGPTAILVAGRFPWEILLLSLLIIGAFVWYQKRKK